MIGFEQDGRVGRVFLQRASHANAFTSEMLGRTAEILETAPGESDVIVIHAVGDDFSLGRDREEPKHPGGPYAGFSEISRVNAAFAAFPGIVVTAIKGRAFGFGLGLAMRSDIAIAAHDARFMLDEVSLGFPPMFLMEVIHEHLPPKRALDLILSSREFDAAEALDIGLLSRVVPADRLEAEVDEFVATLGSRNADVLKSCKSYLAAIKQMPAVARPNNALVEQAKFALDHH
jgi:enoyl-CoA hydratase/carnithine racemase